MPSVAEWQKGLGILNTNNETTIFDKKYRNMGLKNVTSFNVQENGGRLLEVQGTRVGQIDF